MNAQDELFSNWDEVRTAYHVARFGTLSAAAGYLNIHHATVIRHIDALEAKLGSKLFQRHARGYSPTEAGLELMRVAAETDAQFSQMAGRLKGQGATVSGDLTITALAGMAPRLMPLLVEFGAEHPDIRLTFLSAVRMLKLEYGEAHVALRAGKRPQEPDNIVKEVGQFSTGLFANKSYVEKFGMIKSIEDFANHRFVSARSLTGRAPFSEWSRAHINEENIVFRSTDIRAYDDAIFAGAGIGFLELSRGDAHSDLVLMWPSLPEWDSQLWIVTHVDMHKTAKVRALAQFLAERLLRDQPI